MQSRIRVYSQDNQIKIEFKIFSDYEVRLVPDSYFLNAHEKYNNQSLIELMLNKFALNENEIKASLKREVTINEEKHEAISTYELPTDPQMALDFINCLDNFIIGRKFDTVHLNEKFLMDLGNSIYDVSTSLELAKAILEMPAQDSYAELFKQLKKLIAWQSTHTNERFENILALKQRLAILYDLQIDLALLAKQDLSIEQKNQYIQKLVSTIISNLPEKELEHLLGGLTREEKMTYYAEFLKNNDDASWQSKQWEVIRHLKFQINKQDLAEINFLENSALQSMDDDAKEKVLMDLETFFEDIKLEFTRDTSNPIYTFSANSTAEIKKLNLHLDGIYFTEYFKMRASSSPNMFRQKSEFKTENIDFVKTFFRLDEDVVKDLYQLPQPEPERKREFELH